MDKKKLEPSIMQRVNEINEIHKQIDPLYQIKNSSKISEIMEQNARISSASNIGEIARKASQQSGLDFASFENQSTIARYADLGFQDMVALQDTFLEARRGLSAYSDTLSMKDRMIQSIGGNNAYKDMMASFSQFRESIEPLKGSFNAARAILETSESFKLVKEIQSQAALVNSLSSEYSSVFKQFESLRNLESFRSISRLSDSQFQEILSTDLTQEDITNFSKKPISEIDSDLSDEVKSDKSFGSYSEKAKKILYFICTVILLQYFIGIASSISANYIQQFQEVSKNLETSREVKSFVRSNSYIIDRQVFKGLRVTTVNTLNFRDNFGMNSTVIDTLPIGTIVRVIDKSDKAWVLIEVEIDGELEQGWVLRRYTTYFK